MNPISIGVGALLCISGGIVVHLYHRYMQNKIKHTKSESILDEIHKFGIQAFTHEVLCLYEYLNFVNTHPDTHNLLPPQVFVKNYYVLVRTLRQWKEGPTDVQFCITWCMFAMCEVLIGRVPTTEVGGVDEDPNSIFTIYTKVCDVIDGDPSFRNSLPTDTLSAVSSNDLPCQ